jgi:protocatechuate 3,4-dioxygenase beta subunit
MQKTKKPIAAVLLLIVLLSSTANSQDWSESGARLVGGPCEGCEAIFEYGDNILSPVDTLPDFKDDGPKIKLTGTVFQNDGRTPAEGAILYIYHTDQNGIYTVRGGETGWARRHGYIRGWVKTGKDGKYTFYTLKPGTYPSRSEPAHIHLTVLEPDGKYYWLESCLFNGDPLISEEDQNKTSLRGGGTRILYLKNEDGLLTGTRDIILGKNVPGYN